MTPFPLNWVELFGHWESYIVYLVIGFAFGYVLEIAGFGNSEKLAAQFYFKDMTVLKVMFTAIVVAMALIFLATGLGLLDYNLVWVNPTYLWPGILGGLVMGVGFIVGGFCPGTSLVSAATLKIDGILFALGVFFGIFLFGETVGFYESFWYSSYMGRFTLMEFLNLDTGIVVLIIILMALFMFWGSEQLERIVGKQDVSKAPRWRYGAAGGLVMLAAAGIWIGQPTTEDRWAQLRDEKMAALANRELQIDPLELLHLIHNEDIKVVMLDVRDERDFNLFHIEDSDYVALSKVGDKIDDFMEEPSNTVFVTISNDETVATEAWRIMVSESVPNVYILGGGINGWINVFADEAFLAEHPRVESADDHLKYSFTAALGARYLPAEPNFNSFEELEYESKVKLETKRGASGGGCG